jgi:hypothetical protein
MGIYQTEKGKAVLPIHFLTNSTFSEIYSMGIIYISLFAKGQLR